MPRIEAELEFAAEMAKQAVGSLSEHRVTWPRRI